ncbi:conserved hypothetical protein [Ricinus communis]|uniref:RALFL33 n=1 Tax=Ricinus communis TaxID=3988 RepID=B9SAD1_RICCO|nr:conserved hypothetical protein [Ricinus communis]|eukprot:XP_002522950.1 protein RALF-like 19 [Ricinus communis]
MAMPKGYVIYCLCILLVSKTLIGEVEARNCIGVLTCFGKREEKSRAPSPTYRRGDVDAKSEIEYGAINEGDPFHCGEGNEKCKREQQMNPWRRGCNQITKCRHRP